MGEAAANYRLMGKKEEEVNDFFFIVKISIYIVTAEISAIIHGEAMR